MNQENKNKEVKKSAIAEMEESVLAWWDENDTFRKSLRARKKGNPRTQRAEQSSHDGKPFVFYEGPPTANGMPHPGHVMGRCFKDLFLRYKSMRGYFVERHAGWDTHGLPVEIEVEKQLGIKNKSDIERLGIAEFNRLCKESVWKYKDEWEKMTRRIGFWLDMEHPYITYDNKYIETLWWVIKQIFDKGLLTEDYKVMHYCARCGTGLSSHEIAQGYKTVKDSSIYVKFEIIDSISYKLKAKSYFLVWTTTPWTLPANVALAVNSKISYVKAKKGDEILILAESRLSVLGEGWEIIERVKGNDLLGLEYQQLFDYLKPDKKAFFVVDADFVSDKDGTGIVHIAPAYGEDDMAAARRHDLPVLHPVKENGEFIDALPWRGVFVKKADEAITEDLKNSGFLFKTEIYEHEYPFCWRCDTPILYYARKSWFIKMSQLKERVIANNQKINWVPAHTKDGRFGEWLRELKDWAFSRDRFWGTPLPIWRCGECRHAQALGSIAELARKSRFKNRYFIMRHGEAVYNAKSTAETSGRAKNHLTQKGIKDVKVSLERFKKKNKGIVPDVIVASPFPRARETAELAAGFFGAGARDIIFELALQEMHIGIFDGKKAREYRKYFSSYEEMFVKRPPGAEENLSDLRVRAVAALRKLEEIYADKTILIVSHEYSLWMLETGLLGFDIAETVAAKKKKGNDYIKTGEIRELKVSKLPLGANGFLDLHKPYSDEITFACEKCGGAMRRVPEVCDVWFDSGAMPLAQMHFPFAQIRNPKSEIRNLLKQIPYPANFITEGVDQTRGWFYTLLAVATLLGLEPPYKNVVSQGHILDKHGKKMSKSKKNYMDPMEVADRYGADALRWYFYITNPVGEPKRFDEKDVLDCQRKSVMVLLNVYNFLTSYASAKNIKTAPRSRNILDRWIVSRLNETARSMIEFMDQYDALSASRALDAFFDDLTNWYVRRSRARFQYPESAADYRAGTDTLNFALAQTLKLAAPFMPFVSEHLWQKMKLKGSAHMADYPLAAKKLIDKQLHYDMIEVRRVVSATLKKRAEVGIKVRQPLAELRITNYELRIKDKKELLDLIKEEVNVKSVFFDNALTEDVWLDTAITPELKNEGTMREIIRHIQQARKEAKLTAKDTVMIIYHSPALREIVESSKEIIRAHTKASDIKAVDLENIKNPNEISIDGEKLWFGF